MRLEEVACDLVAKCEKGEFNPWNERLSINERNTTLLALAKSLGPRYRNCTYGNYRQYDPAQEHVLSELKQFAIEMPDRLCRGGGLILLGRQGTGKDHLLAATLRIAVAKHRLSVAWWDGGALYDRIAESIAEDLYLGLRRQLLKPHILAISDPIPPRGHLTDPQLRRLRDVIDKRYRDLKSTWITTNVDTSEDAAALLTIPLLERITHGSLQLMCDWKSYRKSENQ